MSCKATCQPCWIATNFISKINVLWCLWTRDCLNSPPVNQNGKNVLTEQKRNQWRGENHFIYCQFSAKHHNFKTLGRLCHPPPLTLHVMKKYMPGIGLKDKWKDFLFCKERCGTLGHGLQALYSWCYAPHWQNARTKMQEKVLCPYPNEHSDKISLIVCKTLWTWKNALYCW